MPGTATKNLTASLWPWNDSCACVILQYGIMLPALTLSVLLSEYTRITPPGRLPPVGVGLVAAKTKIKTQT